MKIFLNPPWPQAGLLPAALFRITTRELEKRMGFTFAVFTDEGVDATGFAGITDSSTMFAVMHKPTEEVSMSLYLPFTDQFNPTVLADVLRSIKVDPNEIVHGHESEFSIEDLQQGKHMLPIPNDR